MGYFMKPSFWIDAYKLEEAKINARKTNPHFRTLNTEYYSKISKQIRESISKKEYFMDRVSENRFYDLKNEFFYHRYVSPKNIFGLRNITFMSLPLALVHNAIGLYLLRLTEELLEYINDNKNIRSFYGGMLRYQGDELDVSEKSIYYRDSYKRFREILVSETKEDIQRLVIRIDIENYFDNLSVRNLLIKIRDYVKPKIIEEYRFDKNTINEIETFYRFIMNNKKGIPQVDNGIISNLIGHLYLCFLDILLDDSLRSKGYREYKIIRYVDDIYIIFKPKNLNSRWEKQEEAIELLTCLKDEIFYEFGLKINNKTKIYALEDEVDKTDFFHDTKNNSVAEIMNTPIDIEEGGRKSTDQLIETVKDIFSELAKIKQGELRLDREKDDIKQYILYKLFENSINNFLNKKENKEELKRLFQDFNFNFVKINPLVLTILIMKNEESKDRYMNFLLNKKNLNSNDRQLVIEAIRQLDFGDKKEPNDSCYLGRLYDKLTEDDSFKSVIDTFNNTDLDLNKPGYFDLNLNKTIRFLNNRSTTKQMELRVINENAGDFSVALNHLVNEFQSICENLDPDPKYKGKEYNAISVDKFLASHYVSNRLRIKIRNMFDRRNNNLVSHSGNEEVRGSAVSQDEYEMYKTTVGDVLKALEI